MNDDARALLAGEVRGPAAEWGDDLILASFLRPHLSGLHPYLFEADFPRAVSLAKTLPPEAVLVRKVVRQHGAHVIATLGEIAICVRTWSGGGDLWVSGDDEAQCRGVRNTILRTVPRPRSRRELEVAFWSVGSHGGGRRSTRRLSVPRWAEVASNYPAAARAAMEALVAVRRPGDGSGRLLLWHGPPGTGKTTAVRALLREWRSWSAARYVTDPERLFHDAAYLNHVVFDDDAAEKRWRVVVIEDAEEFLRRDARAVTGQALGRLLNLSDGMLGQGSRTLILLTSNEQLQDLQPALLRPGRCLARVEFGRLSLSESAQVARRPVDRELTLAEALEARGTLARLDVAAPRQAVGMYL